MPARLFFALLLCFGTFAQNTTFRGGTDQVLLDFVVRDKHQKIVKNLTSADVTVMEDGVPQKILSFDYRGGEIRRDSGALPNKTGSSAYDPSRELNVVTIAYGSMSIAGRRRAAEIVNDFLKNQIVDNTYVGMFMMGYRLVMLQGYTNDPGLLSTAARQASLHGFEDLQKRSQQELATLSKLQFSRDGVDPATFSSAHPGSAEERGPESSSLVAASRKQMLIMEIQMVNQVLGGQSMDQLLSLIKQQSQLPGRKTVLYLSEGLEVPAESPERLRHVISAANRANVTFYTADCAGLTPVDTIEIAARTASAMDSAPVGNPSLHYNVEQNLAELAEGTGGTAMLNSNDLRSPLQRVMEDVRSHYEITYRPVGDKYDGHFRTISLEVSRPGVKIQSRRGYYALPPSAGQGLQPFEVAGMNALNQSPLPNAFTMRSAALWFPRGEGPGDVLVAFEVPTRDLRTETSLGDTFRIHPGFFGVIKNGSGEVVTKLSRDMPFQASREKLEAFRAGFVSAVLPITLEPGRYTLETAAIDQVSLTASARRSVLMIPEHDAFALSDILLVRRTEAATAADGQADLFFEGQRITPALSNALPFTTNGVISVFFRVDGNESKDPATAVSVDLRRDGKLIRSYDPAHGTAFSARGYLLGIPMQGLETGDYEINVILRSGAKAIRHTLGVTLK